MRRLLIFGLPLLLTACEGETGERGAVGPAGEDGAPCTVSVEADGKASITCPDGTKAEVPNASCTIVDGSDGGRVLRCSDGTETKLPDAPDAQKGSIVGTMALRGIGPLAGIEVTLQPGAKRVVSDAEGKVRFDDLPVGIYRVEAKFEGYVSAVIENVGVLPGTWNLGEVVLQVSRAFFADPELEGEIALSPDGETLLAMRYLPTEEQLAEIWSTGTAKRIDLGRVGYVDLLDSKHVWTMNYRPEGDGSHIRVIALPEGETVAEKVLDHAYPSGICGDRWIVEGSIDGESGMFAWEPGGAPVHLDDETMQFVDCWDEEGLVQLARWGGGRTIIVDLADPGRVFEYVPDDVRLSRGLGLIAAHMAGGPIGLRPLDDSWGYVSPMDVSAFWLADDEIVFLDTSSTLFRWDSTGRAPVELTSEVTDGAFVAPGWFAWSKAGERTAYSLADGRSFSLPSDANVWPLEDPRWLVFDSAAGIGVADLSDENPTAEIPAPSTRDGEWVDGVLYFRDPRYALYRWNAGATDAEKLADFAEVWDVAGGSLAFHDGIDLVYVDLVSGDRTVVSNQTWDRWMLSEDGAWLAFVEDASSWSVGRVYDVAKGLTHELDRQVGDLSIRGSTLVWDRDEFLDLRLSDAETEIDWIWGRGLHWARLR